MNAFSIFQYPVSWICGFSAQDQTPGERGEGQFSRNPPVFSPLSCLSWIHSYLLGHYKIGPPLMELLELGREHDPSTNEPCRNPHQAPPSLRSPSWQCHLHTGRKPPRPQKQQKADVLPTDYWSVQSPLKNKIQKMSGKVRFQKFALKKKKNPPFQCLAFS